MDSERIPKLPNVAKVNIYSPFRYPGGKSRWYFLIKEWVRATSPKLFVEPFAGGAHAGLTVAIEDWDGNDVEQVVLIERDPDVAAVWRTILGDDCEWLIEKIMNFEMSLPAAEEAVSRREESVRRRAWATIIRNRAIRGGLITPDSGWLNRGEKDRGLNSRWYPDTLSDRIRSIHEHKDIIEFIQGDAFEEWSGYIDEERAIHFIDPPYPESGKRLYKYSEVGYEKVLFTSKSIEGDFLITYENTENIKDECDRLKLEYRRVEVKNANHDSKGELLIGKNLEWLRKELKSK